MQNNIRVSEAGAADSARADLTLQQMRAAVALALGEPVDTVLDHDDLIHRGLDSIAIMRLANVWRLRGVELKFAELIATPKLATWWALAAARDLSEAGSALPDVSVDESQPFELAPMQQAYWIGATQRQLISPVSAQYYVEFDGKGVEPAHLERAVLALQNRHPMLRARFLAEGRQQIMEHGAWQRLELNDLTAASSEAAQQELLRIRERLASRRMAIERGEVFDIQLSLLANRACRMHVTITMLVADARSFQIFLDDLALLYAEPGRGLKPLQYTFQKYLAFQAVRRNTAREQAKVYWQGKVALLPERPLLPLAIEQRRLGQHTVGRRYYWVPPRQQQMLEQHCRQHGITLSTALLHAFVEIIGAWSVEPRFLINMPLFDREEWHPDVGSIVGDFSNLLIVSADVTHSAPFAEGARRLQAALLSDASHAEYSGLEVLREIAKLRPGDWTFAPVVFTSAIGMGDLFSQTVRECFGRPGWTVSQTPQVWLDFQVTERDGGLLLNWDLIEEIFPEGMVDTLFDAYVSLLAWLADTGPHWSEVRSLLPRPQQSVRRAVNSCGGVPPSQLLHEGFFARAAEDPDRLALAWGENQAWAYGVLAERARAVSRSLREAGVEPGDTVAITMSRSADYIAAVLGVLAAAAVFVPVSADQPVLRRAQIYASAGARLVLTRAQDWHALEWPDTAPVLVVESAYEKGGSTDELSNAGPNSLAYVIYTSGSTGTPKGVEMTHAAAMNTISDVNERFGVGAEDRVLAVSAADFDLSIYDIFGLLSVGGALVLVDEQSKIDARQWLELAGRWRVSIWNSVPALLDMLLVSASAHAVDLQLRVALVSGDWVPLDLPARLRAACPDCRFIALGGATEAAIWSNFIEVEQVDSTWRSIPYGLPLRNQKFRVVDSRNRDRPDWVAGDLWIGGHGVAQGYRGDPERTALQFVEHEGERWYKTGDRARYWPTGSLEFLGRRDLQVKIRGHRIELGEVEAALAAHPCVRRAAVVVARGGQLGAFLCADSGAVTDAEIKAFCVARLPRYMVPSAIVLLQELPLTANGKVDRRELERLLMNDRPIDEEQLPASGLQAAVAKIWSDLLGIENIGCGQNFFVLGGDSLLATRLIAKIRGALGAELSLLQMQLAPTIRELTALIENARGSVEEGVI